MMTPIRVFAAFVVVGLFLLVGVMLFGDPYPSGVIVSPERTDYTDLQVFLLEERMNAYWELEIVVEQLRAEGADESLIHEVLDEQTNHLESIHTRNDRMVVNPPPGINQFLSDHPPRSTREVEFDG